jgi:hypothetical protein
VDAENHFVSSTLVSPKNFLKQLNVRLQGDVLEVSSGPGAGGGGEYILPLLPSRFPPGPEIPESGVSCPVPLTGLSPPLSRPSQKTRRRQ